MKYHRGLMQAECRKIAEMDRTTVTLRRIANLSQSRHAMCIEQTHSFVSGL